MPDTTIGGSVLLAAAPLRLWRLPLAEDLSTAALRQAAALGFGQVVLAPEALPHAAPEPPREALALARGERLDVLLEVTLDRVAAGSPLSAPGAPFLDPDPAAARDPRQAVDPTAALARVATPHEAEALAGWWVARLAPLAASGVRGFLLRGLAGIPASLLPAVLGVLRRGLPEALLLVWAPGLSREAMRALASVPLDGSIASLPWWDFAAPWLFEEIEILREAGPVIGLPCTEGAGRVDARSLAFAATLGGGWMLGEAPAEAQAMIRTLNRLLAEEPALAGPATPVPLSGENAPVLATLHTDAPDRRQATRGVVALINTDAARPRALDPARVLAATGAVLGAFLPVLPETAPPLAPGEPVTLAPGEARLYAAGRAAAVAAPPPVAAAEAARWPRLGIEAVSPAVDDGAFPVKRTVGETVRVEADIVFDGHDQVAGALRWRAPGDEAWSETRLRPLGNDRWAADFPLAGLGRHLFTVEAWKDRFATYRDELGKKSAAGLDVSLELREGEALLAEAATRSPAVTQLLRDYTAADAAGRRALLLGEPLAQAMRDADERPHRVRTEPYAVDAERIEARFASWYEVFPRSLSDDPHRHGTFADVERHLPRIRAMGFDVLYFPPIHPIGRKNRKGRNNTLTPAPDDPGSPYAIGSEEGGHDALHPQLGTLDDLRRLRVAAESHGLELAMDFAIQCSPDHPWLRQHPEWFDWRPDGTIRYAENPPKKYEDIVNVDFYADGAVPSLWQALCDVVMFWAGQGIRLFRVDNPHTKPFPFWQWLIGEVRRDYPDAIFLAEAFTRPKIMYRLAKIGFSQSYTYFTWRNDKAGLTDYLTELATTAPREFFRPHFFVNTPDINPVFLQTSGRPGFLIRAALAATLSGLWGVYNGFELCEGTPMPGKEEYLDSEKYQLRAWDWNRPGNIVVEITALNRMRRMNPALQTHLGVTFLNAANPQVLFFEKATEDRSNVVLVAVSLDPFGTQSAEIEVPLWRWRLPDDAPLRVADLVRGGETVWYGKVQRVTLTQDNPYAIWRAWPE